MKNKKGQFTKGQRPWNTGKKRPPFSEEWKKKISEKLKNNVNSKNHKHSEETKRKMSEAKKGNIPWNKKEKVFCIDCSKELKNKKSKRCKKCYNKKRFGSKRTEETRRKMSFSARGKNHDYQKGDRNINWKGGISENPYPKEFNRELKLKIRERDNFTCCLCERTEREELEELNRVLSVNHIDFDKNNCKEKNLNTLCLRCNIKINRDREYWTNYFQQND